MNKIKYKEGAITLQLKILPKAENVSYMALLSIVLSKFLIKTLPTPDLRSEGSLWDHIIRIGRPLIVSKFIVSKARSAEKKKMKFQF
jgi:hypothetical protein